MASLSSFGFPSEPSASSVAASRSKLGSPSCLRSSDGQTSLPLQSSSAKVDVHDFLAEVIVKQEYVNNSSKAISAVYSFPMDSKACVNGLRMVRGDVVVEGHVKEREAARKEYTAAVKSGKVASLLEEDAASGDIFEASVGNIPAGDTVHITLSYITELDVEDGKLRLHLPTAIGARAGEAPAASKGVSGAAAVSGCPLSVEVAVRAHSAITSIDCPSHEVTTQLGVDGSSRSAKVSLTHGSLSLGSDFRLLISQLKPHTACVWLETPPHTDAAVDTAKPTDATAASASGGNGVVAGPNDVSRAPASMVACMFPDMQAMDLDNDAAGEYIFVVDRSGSMSGSRMRHAQDALQMCLRAIPAGSTFNIVGFGTRIDELFSAPRPYNDDTLAQAAEHVKGMKANLGGTDLMTPLQSVFARAPSPSLPRQVLLLTDGEVRDTRAVVALVRRSCAPSGTRVFTFGIGREVSHALVVGCATAGGGAAEFISPDERMESKVMRQMNKAVQPVMTNVGINWGELADFATHAGTPAKSLPLFQGSRTMRFTALQLTAGEPGALRSLPATATVTLTADTPDGPMEWPMLVRLPATLVAASAAAAGVEPPAPVDSDDEDEDDVEEVQCSVSVGRLVATAAARSRIRDLEALSTAKAKEEGTKLACAYDVACKWASFVAVDMDSSVADVGELQEELLGGQEGARNRGGGRSRGGRDMRKKSKARVSARTSSTSSMSAVDRVTRRSEALDSLTASSSQLNASSARFKAEAPEAKGGGFFGSISSALGFGGSSSGAAPSQAAAGARSLAMPERAMQAEAQAAYLEDSEDEDDSLNEYGTARFSDCRFTGDAPPMPPSGAMFGAAPPVGAAMAAPPGASAAPQQQQRRRAPAATSASLTVDAASSTPEQQLKAIVALQRSDGSFDMGRAVAQLTLKSAAEVDAAAPAVADGGDAALAAAMWATALVLAVLEARIGDFREEWSAMAGKAGKWMRRNAQHLQVEGGDAKAKVAALQAQAAAFLQ